MFINIELIDVSDRIRQDNGKDWEQFKQSFPKFGQLQPIRVEQLGNGRYLLISGWRRLTAIKEHHANGTVIPAIPPGQIEVTYRDDPVPLHTKLLMEFAENNDREDFNFLEKAKFIRRFHETMQLEHGVDVWDQKLTAHTLNLSQTSISFYLRVEEEAKNDPSVAKAATLDAAVKRVRVNEATRARLQQVKQEAPDAHKRASDILAFEDARSWIKRIPSESVDLVNFDPPWGDNTSHKSAENHEEFDDSTEYSDSLMRDLFPEILRILKDNRFCIFWHRLWATERMAATAESFGFNLQFTRSPGIWYKPDKVSDQNRYPEKQMIEAYEPFYLLRKGDPIFHERYVNNVFAFPRVPLSALIHPTEKPLDLTDALIKLCSIPGETICDPTAGSSGFLHSALKNNRKAIGCELSQKYYERGIARLASYLGTFKDG